MEILTPWSSQVHPEAQPNGVQATEGYSKKLDILDPGEPRKSDVSLFMERISK
jgi:hypothetical protein